MQNNILVSITGDTENDWQEKLQEIEKLGIKEVALFLEMYNKAEKQKIYDALLTSGITSIPLVHIRHDMARDELEFLKKNFGTQYFTCHEENFAHHDIEKWRGFYNHIYLEMNFDNFVSKKVNVEKIGGFCIDLAHFKCGLEKLSRDFEYVFEHRDKKLFMCNHLNGWEAKKNVDMHTIKNLSDFDYLKTLPKFVFGKIIALEMTNSIKEQLEFKRYLTRLLSEGFEKK
ncbi:MAG: hypothetical protein A3D44_00465 [Candidatus Staskawiczbacteria bacterium RIFCSPHIGHO2_02_FULL_42_22]|uniref:Xylose isomerase-like TIM barrel domain-containing protein n=1 Tax=Candidatus Staskawiczbacteria bacterium RIFCSPHIGHO2_02_FULL_42_22 TaxID=1802207 RepID=A0A1G2I5K8_9BACT|nr:MAG: hypothetical protein A3D44_00465 [Candidatus Staskawiczbacteria bacterium RIFCSPHIGHO2_02_FULL_42_22]